MINYGQKLNPERTLRVTRGISGNRQKVIVTHNPSEIDQNQLLEVRFPNLGKDDVIIPGTVKLSFNVTLSGTDVNRTLVSNIGRAIVKKLAVKFEGNEILSIDDYDIYACYRDLWKTISEKRNAVRQGIIHSGGCTENCMRNRIGAGNKDDSIALDKTIANAYGNKFIIPLDFELLESSAPYYQAGLGNRLCYEITFNEYGRVIVSVKNDAKYRISDISLEYDIVTHEDLAQNVRLEYQSMILPYDRVLRHRQIRVNKSDTIWNWSFNTPAKSLKGILVLFENEVSFSRNTSRFNNPNIEKVTITVEGKPNQLFAQGLRSFSQYEEICKYFAEGNRKGDISGEVQKHLELNDLSVGEYLTNNYALWLDFRTIDENALHGTGRLIENASEGITIQIEKKAEAAAVLNAYIYLIMDAQLRIEDGAFKNVLY